MRAAAAQVFMTGPGVDAVLSRSRAMAGEGVVLPGGPVGVRVYGRSWGPAGGATTGDIRDWVRRRLR
jgi:hypothetical protein